MTSNGRIWSSDGILLASAPRSLFLCHAFTFLGFHLPSEDGAFFDSVQMQLCYAVDG